MLLSGQSNALGSGGFFSQSQPAQQTQQTNNAFGQTLGSGPQGSTFGASAMQPPQQVQQMPVLAQSAAQLSSSLWQPGKETPRKSQPPPRSMTCSPSWRLTWRYRPEADSRPDKTRNGEVGPG